MFQAIKTAASAIASALNTSEINFFINDTGRVATKDNTGTVKEYAYLDEIGGGGGGSASIPEILTTTTVGRAFVFADLQNLVPYNSASDASFTIPNDATLGITGANLTKNYSIDLVQFGNGKPTFVAGAGVTLTPWAGYPTTSAAVTQTAHRVAANTWYVK